MIYEIYLDSIFAEILIWNLCVLKLTDGGFFRLAGNRKILLGGAAGTLGYTLSLFVPLPGPGKSLFAAVCCGGMLCFTFPVKSFKNFMRVVEEYLKYGILLGGAMLLFLRLPISYLQSNKIWLSAAAVILMTKAGLLLQGRTSKGFGKAVLIQKKKRISVNAFVDSGNGLTEPISGKPVCVLDKCAAKLLWGEQDLFRAIPYRSVGKEKGIMKGYLLSQMNLEWDGPVRIFRDIYVAVSPQELTSEKGKVQMLIHPALLTGEQTKNQAEKERREYTE